MKAVFRESAPIHVTFSDGEHHGASIGSYIEIPIRDYYDGDYSVTPSSQEQTIHIIGKTARQNITVAPIPSNYGLIEWNGAALTVS